MRSVFRVTHSHKSIGTASLAIWKPPRHAIGRTSKLCEMKLVNFRIQLDYSAIRLGQQEKPNLYFIFLVIIPR